MQYKKNILVIIALIIFFITSLPNFVFGNGYKILMFLWNGETNAEKGFKDALNTELSDQNIRYIILDTYKSSDRLKELIETTDEAEYDLIYTYGSGITPRVVKSFKNTPIVFNIVFDPIGYRIIESWDEKPPNVTGASNSIPFEIIVNKIFQVFGKGDLGIIYNPLDKKSGIMKDEMGAYLEQQGVNLLPFEFKEDFNSLNAYVDSVKHRIKCIYLPTEYLVAGYVERIFAITNKVKIPTCVTGKAYLERGGVLCISAEYYDVGKMAGRLAAQILKGAKPADLQIQRPTESGLTIFGNSYMIKRLGLELPKDLNIKYIK